jgi:pyruvate kinase
MISSVFNSTDEIVKDAVVKSKEFMDMNNGDLIVITGGFPNNEKTTNFMKIEKL